MTAFREPNLVEVGCVDPLMGDIIVAELRRAGLQAVTFEHEAISSGLPTDIASRVVLLDNALVGLQPALLNDVLRSGGKVLVLGATESPAVISSLMAGASGAVDMAETTSSALVDAIKQVARGEAALHPAVAAAILDQWRRGLAIRGAELQAQLTVREMEVVRAMGAGVPAREVARTLGLSVKTVEAHKARIYDKLGVRGQAAAVQHAIKRGWIDAEETTHEV